MDVKYSETVRGLQALENSRYPKSTYNVSQAILLIAVPLYIVLVFEAFAQGKIYVFA